jgi:hypothetical protein
MARDDQIVKDRVALGLCPICGKKSEGKTTLVFDAKFGEVFICERHIVQGSNKLEE